MDLKINVPTPFQRFSGVTTLQILTELSRGFVDTNVNNANLSSEELLRKARLNWGLLVASPNEGHYTIDLVSHPDDTVDYIYGRLSVIGGLVDDRPHEDRWLVKLWCDHDGLHVQADPKACLA